MPDNAALLTFLQASVPLWIKRVGQLDWNERTWRASLCSEVIATHGDDLMFGGRHCAETANRLAEGMAIGAHAPGGITFAGLHWCVGSGHTWGVRQQESGPCGAEVEREHREGPPVPVERKRRPVVDVYLPGGDAA